ncbi:MAG: hypothetical protein ACKOKC_15750 [Chthoniobacterales bacterium]
MKILIVNRFFGGAQIPTGRMAEDVARVLVEAGHEVVALASSGEYVGAARRADGIRHTACGTRVEQVRVPKWMPRALAWVWFTWQARKRIPRIDWDVCVLMTDPPLLPLLAAKAACGEWRVASDECTETEHQPEDRTTETPPHRPKRRVAVWLMDLYPEALAASGWIGRNNPIYKWYFEKRQRALGAADLLICLGEAQKALAQKYEGEKVGRWEGSSREQGIGHGEQVAGKTGRPNYRPTEIPTPTLTQCVRTVVVPPWDDRGNIALATEGSLKNLALYAGNLGEAHCFEEILAAAPHLPGDWTIRFAARGAKLAALKAAASVIRHTAESIRSEAKGTRDESGSGSGVNSGSLKLTDLKLKTAPSELKRLKDQEAKRLGAKIEITGYASEGETPGLLASARVHLITMSPGWEGIVVPSKLYGCIRTGRPVLFIGPENADTAREIRANDWGKVLPPGASGEDVAAAILHLAEKSTSSAQVRNGAQLVARSLERLAENCSSTVEH